MARIVDGAEKPFVDFLVALEGCRRVRLGELLQLLQIQANRVGEIGEIEGQQVGVGQAHHGCAERSAPGRGRRRNRCRRNACTSRNRRRRSGRCRRRSSPPKPGSARRCRDDRETPCSPSPSPARRCAGRHAGGPPGAPSALARAVDLREAAGASTRRAWSRDRGCRAPRR